MFMVRSNLAEKTYITFSNKLQFLSNRGVTINESNNNTSIASFSQGNESNPFIKTYKITSTTQ